MAWYTSKEFELSRQGSETRQGAETIRQQMPHPHSWYVWQMNDGRWHISRYSRPHCEP